jgi:hypothetical protein
VVVTN